MLKVRWKATAVARAIAKGRIGALPAPSCAWRGVVAAAARVSRLISAADLDKLHLRQYTGADNCILNARGAHGPFSTGAPDVNARGATYEKCQG